MCVIDGVAAFTWLLNLKMTLCKADYVGMVRGLIRVLNR
jgi:hypothetical protein